MKKLGLVVALSAVIGLASTASMAAETSPSFDFVTGSYINLDADGTHIGGAQIDYSQSFGENFFGYGFGRYLSKGDIDNTSLAVGLGYKHHIGSSTAVYGVLGFAYDDVSWGSMGESDTGYIVSAGVRHVIGKAFEIDVNVQHVDLWDDTEQNYTVSGKYYINPVWAVQAGYTYVDGDNSLMSLGLSYNF